ncbi:MAG TPA: NUDIX hydrolase [Solibacterales bacterium]|nr:NUDIX hydrolase [Bryobacterales bacterium]
MAAIHKIGLLLVRDGRILLCRKRQGARLILPGGKPEAGEAPLACLERELREELGEVALSGATFLGSYVAPAAGEAAGVEVRVDLYTGELHGTPRPMSEIDELVWFEEGDDWRRLAPSIALEILPDLIRRGILPWSTNDQTSSPDR